MTNVKKRPLTLTQVRRRYTRVVQAGPHWKTFIQIDHQGFCIVDETDRARAYWFAKMAAVALHRLIASAH